MHLETVCLRPIIQETSLKLMKGTKSQLFLLSWTEQAMLRNGRQQVTDVGQPFPLHFQQHLLQLHLQILHAGMGQSNECSKMVFTAVSQNGHGQFGLFGLGSLCFQSSFQNRRPFAAGAEFRAGPSDGTRGHGEIRKWWGNDLNHL